LDPCLRPLATLAAHARDRDQAAVVNADLRARLFLDRADRLALWPDDLADLLRVDLNRDDPRRPLRQLAARLGHDLGHLAEDVQATLACPLERSAHHIKRETRDLDVHLDGRDALLRAGDLEVHVTERVLHTED